jgi:hypothetical protein
MTRDEKIQILNNWETAIEAARLFIEPVFSALFLPPENPISSGIDILAVTLTAATAKLVDDKAGWLDWYATKNDFGRKCLSAGYMGHEKAIKSLEDLMGLIEAIGEKSETQEQWPTARSLTDEMMDCVDRLGSEADQVDPRVWDHLLIYAPQPAAAEIGKAMP